MKKEMFEAIRAKTAAIFAITKDNLGVKSIEIINSFPRYYDTYVAEYEIYSNLLVEKEKLYGELFNKYRFDNQKDARSKIEIEPFIHSDEAYYQLCLRANEQEKVVKYMEGICDAIKKVSYNIKNIIELKNLGMQI
jgi:hypothetical protein